MSLDEDLYPDVIERDGRGRPKITPAGRNGKATKGKPTSYTRVSTFAKALDDGSGLTTWKVRHAVVGVAQSPDLAKMVAAMGRDLNDYTPDDKKFLDAIVERAHDRSGGNVKADYGTAVHSLTEPDRDAFGIDDGMMRDVAAYDQLIADLDLEVVDTEVFIVNDDVKVAGTFDHKYRLRRDLTFTAADKTEVTLPAGLLVIGDKKTGKLHLGQHAIQLASYARGRKIDFATHDREALDVSPQWGLVLHIPKGEGKASAIPVDLHRGWEAAKLALKVRDYRSTERTLGALLGEAVVEHDVEAVDGVAHPDGTFTPAAPAEALAGDTDPFGTGVVEHVAAIKEDVETLAAVTATPLDVVAPPEHLPSQDPGDPAAPRDRVTYAEPEPAAPPAVEVDEFGDPIGPATIADAVANLARAGLQPSDAILDAINAAPTPDACREVWTRNPRAWGEHHTAAVTARAALMGWDVNA